MVCDLVIIYQNFYPINSRRPTLLILISNHLAKCNFLAIAMVIIFAYGWNFLFLCLFYNSDFMNG